MSQHDDGQLAFDFDRDRSIQEQFESFDLAHPEVYELFVAFAKAVRSRRSRYSADAILHRIRWEVALGHLTTPKINNNFASRYARKLMSEDPSFSGFFELRVLKNV